VAIREIVKYGDPVLSRPAELVRRFDAELEAVVADMVETMYAAPGVGLAAPQIGISLRLAVIDISVGAEPDALIVMANPSLVSEEGEQESEEGCLSIPGCSEIVRTAAEVEIRAQDLSGNEFTRRGDGLLARAFRHEIDHLNGSLYIDRLPSLRRAFFVRRLKKRIRAGTAW